MFFLNPRQLCRTNLKIKQFFLTKQFVKGLNVAYFDTLSFPKAPNIYFAVKLFVRSSPSASVTDSVRTHLLSTYKRFKVLHTRH